MPKDLNLIQIKDSKFGKYSVILSSDQLKELGKHGATVIENTGNKNQSSKTSSGRISISPDSQRNHESGFVGNTTDWSQFFPNEENAKVPELIAKAKKWEDNFELALTALTAFIGAGLRSYAGGGLSGTSVSNIFGPFVKLYTKGNSEIAENLQELLDNIDSVHGRVQEREINDK